MLHGAWTKEEAKKKFKKDNESCYGFFSSKKRDAVLSNINFANVYIMVSLLNRPSYFAQLSKGISLSK